MQEYIEKCTCDELNSCKKCRDNIKEVKQIYIYKDGKKDEYIEKILTQQKEEIRKMVEDKAKKGSNGEGLPFENSPEIYGNQRQEAYKKGYNQALEAVIKELE